MSACLNAQCLPDLIPHIHHFLALPCMTLFHHDIMYDYETWTRFFSVCLHSVISLHEG